MCRWSKIQNSVQRGSEQINYCSKKNKAWNKSSKSKNNYILHYSFRKWSSKFLRKMQYRMVIWNVTKNTSSSNLGQFFVHQTCSLLRYRDAGSNLHFYVRLISPQFSILKIDVSASLIWKFNSYGLTLMVEYLRSSSQEQIFWRNTVFCYRCSYSIACIAN